MNIDCKPNTKSTTEYCLHLFSRFFYSLMPRAPIYPEVEQFIALKKLTKLETVQSSNITETSTAQS
jgi:hypothetical protein